MSFIEIVLQIGLLAVLIVTLKKTWKLRIPGDLMYNTNNFQATNNWCGFNLHYIGLLRVILFLFFPLLVLDI